MSFIGIQNVTFGYDRQPVLKNLTLRVEKHAFWGIVGPNGSGKSTFLKVLNGQLKPQAGTVEIEARRVSAYSSRQLAGLMSMVRQEFVPVFGFTVQETVMMARFYRRKSGLFEETADVEAVQRALQATDTLEFAARPLGHLSGGERQRVFIARALAQQTPVLLLDEPTSHLDLKHQVRIFDLLKQMQAEQGKTVILVTHDINLACQYCDCVLLLGSEGTYFQGQPDEVLTEKRIEHIFHVKGYQGRLSRQKFFLPLGQYSKDRSVNDI